MTRWIGLSLLTLTLLLPARSRAEWVEWVLDADLAARFDSNANRADSGSEVEHDFSYRLSTRFGRVYQWADRTRVVASADLGGELYTRFEELDAIDAGGQLAVMHKFGVGDAPWLRAFVSGGYAEVREEQRSGPRVSAGIVAGKRLSPRLDARLRYQFTRRFADDGPAVVPGTRDDVFDQQSHEVSLEGGYLLTERLSLNAGFSYRRGDFDSNARGSRFRVLARDHVEAVARDRVFGGWVYRIEGNGYSPFVALDYSLSDRWSLDLGYRFQYAEGGGLDYDNHAVKAAVLFRY